MPAYSLRTRILPSDAVLRLGVLFESVLFILALVWGALRKIHLNLTFGWWELSITAATVILLAALNYFFFVDRPTQPWRTEFLRFRKEFVEPFALRLDLGAGIVLALMSGFAEELLFRGIILSELLEPLGFGVALIISSALFAAAHFGLALLRFPRVFSLYTVAGLALGTAMLLSGSLSASIAAHAAYNFLAFYFISHGFSSAKKEAISTN